MKAKFSKNKSSRERKFDYCEGRTRCVYRSSPITWHDLEISLQETDGQRPVLVCSEVFAYIPRTD